MTVARVVTGLLLMVLIPDSLAAEAGAKTGGGATEKTTAADQPGTPDKGVSVTTRHTVQVADGAEISYDAVAATLILEDTEELPAASMFFVAYTRNDVPPETERPIMFCFNGGPGSSSVWLHLGAFGPKRVVLPREGAPEPPPYGLTENRESILDVTDLVFIDPVSTGYSRAIPPGKRKAFHSVRSDIHSVSRFIRLYCTRFKRWNSPKYVAGESYGGLRAAGVAAYLHDRFGMDLNGVVFVSPVLNFQTIAFDPGNDLPHALALPSYTAAAWYHEKLAAAMTERPLQQVLDDVETFAANEYRQALFSGAALPEDRRNRVAQQLATFTGLDSDYVTDSNLRIHPLRFAKELLREKSMTVGRFDARQTGRDRDAVGDIPEYDPSYHAVHGPFATVFNRYISQELEFSEDQPYRTLATEAVRPWRYQAYENRYANVAEDLRRAMSRNSYLRVFVATGTFDLATPYLATEYTVRHLWLSPERKRHITLKQYDAGHMFYNDDSQRRQFADDIRAFIKPEE